MSYTGYAKHLKVLGREFEGEPFFKRVSLNNKYKISIRAPPLWLSLFIYIIKLISLAPVYHVLCRFAAAYTYIAEVFLFKRDTA